jgi:hypothetical protein
MEDTMSTRTLTYQAALRRVMAAKSGDCAYTRELRAALDVLHREHERQAKEREQARRAGKAALCQRPD